MSAESWTEKRLDVSDLEPPEPLERAVKALDELGKGEYLRMIHRREPCLLYPMLPARGLTQRTHQREDGMVEVLIWHDADEALTRYLTEGASTT